MNPFKVVKAAFLPEEPKTIRKAKRTADGSVAAVEASESIKLSEPVKVYNFEVEDFHTYYVSEQKVLVHNTCAMTAKNSTSIASAGKLKGGSGATSSNIDASIDLEFEEWLNRGEANNIVYFGMIGEKAKYTGITKQKSAVRLAQHQSCLLYTSDAADD